MIKQNQTEDIFGENCYDFTMLDEVDGGNGFGIKTGTNTDFLIEGNVFDCYSPEPMTKIDNICRTIKEKTKKQAERIVFNLDDYPEV